MLVTEHSQSSKSLAIISRVCTAFKVVPAGQLVCANGNLTPAGLRMHRRCRAVSQTAFLRRTESIYSSSSVVPEATCQAQLAFYAAKVVDMPLRC